MHILNSNRRNFLQFTGLAGMGLAGSSWLQARASQSESSNIDLTTLGRKVFVEAGKPVAVVGAATKDMRQSGNELIIPPDKSWGNPLYAAHSLDNEDFHIHARLTLDKLGGTGASFLIGGHYHYPCSRGEGNRNFRIELDDELMVYVQPELDTPLSIVYGRTEQRAPWSQAKKTVAGKTGDYIEAGRPFNIDAYQKGGEFSFQINGQEVFKTRLSDFIHGPNSDDNWPVSFGFFADRGTIRVHEFSTEGSFCTEFLEHRDVWTIGQDGYGVYRIPSLCVTPRGTLLAFAEARRFDFARGRDWNDRSGDEVHCVLKRSTDGGKSWSTQKVLIAQGSGYEARDPSPVVDWETGDVYVVTSGPYIMKAENDGESWSKPRSLRGILTSEIRSLTAGPCSGIQLRYGAHKGRLVVPAYGGRGSGGSGTAVIYSDDHGETWKLGGATQSGSVEPNIAELEDGRLMINARNGLRVEPGRLISISTDGGASFQPQKADPRYFSHTCQATFMRSDTPRCPSSKNGGPLLFCGPAEGRRNLTVMLSRDDTASWPDARMIYSGRSAYSAMAILPDGRVGVLFERDGYRRLSYASFPLDWLTR